MTGKSRILAAALAIGGLSLIGPVNFGFMSGATNPSSGDMPGGANNGPTNNGGGGAAH